MVHKGASFKKNNIIQETAWYTIDIDTDIQLAIPLLDLSKHKRKIDLTLGFYLLKQID